MTVQTLEQGNATALFDITPLQPSLGALISGIDLAKPLDRPTTVFANAVAAYQTLDDETKAQIDGLTAIHDTRHMERATIVGDRPVGPTA